MMSQTRSAFRNLALNWGNTVITIVALALGIGSATAVFSVVDWILFRHSSYPQDICLIGAREKDSAFIPSINEAAIRTFEEQSHAFTEYGLANGNFANIIVSEVPISATVLSVTANLLSMLDIYPANGRGFDDVDGQIGGEYVALLSHSFWSKNFHANDDVVGKSIQINDALYTVIGILGKGQHLPVHFRSDVLIPLISTKGLARWDKSFLTIGRLRTGTETSTAEEELNQVVLNSPPQFSALNRRISVVPLNKLSDYYNPSAYWILVVAVGLLYLIACTNAASLVIIRTLGQSRETAVRLSLGASRLDIIRPLLCEGAMIAGFSSAVGLVIANWCFPLFLAISLNQPLTGAWQWTLSWRAFIVLMGTTFCTLFVIVLVPVLKIGRYNLQDFLKSGGTNSGSGAASHRIQKGVVILQIALSVILVMSTGLMTQTFNKMRLVRLGFNPDSVVRMRIQVTTESNGEESRNAFASIVNAIQLIPSVHSVAYGTDNLLAGWHHPMVEVGSSSGATAMVQTAYMSDGYLKAAGMNLLQGRGLESRSRSEIIITESLAKALLGETPPVGEIIRPASGGGGLGGWRIVGVVSDIRHSIRQPPGKYLYFSAASFPGTSATFVIRLSRSLDWALESEIRKAAGAAERGIIITQLMSFEDIVKGDTRGALLAFMGLRILTAGALFLTTIGVFAMLTHILNSNGSEIGVRLALGAPRFSIFRFILLKALRLTILGMLLGFTMAQAFTQLMESVLYETDALDPLAMILTVAIITALSLAAAFLPALRSTQFDISRLIRRSST